MDGERFCRISRRQTRITSIGKRIPLKLSFAIQFEDQVPQA